jgi:hypothetical protein
MICFYFDIISFYKSVGLSYVPYSTGYPQSLLPLVYYTYLYCRVLTKHTRVNARKFENSSGTFCQGKNKRRSFSFLIHFHPSHHLISTSSIFSTCSEWFNQLCDDHKKGSERYFNGNSSSNTLLCKHTSLVVDR